MIITSSPDPGQVGRLLTVRADEEETVIGRSATCDLEILCAAVSRRHAIFKPTESSWTIRDLGSQHGTFVNGTRLEQNATTEISPRARIQLGPVIMHARSEGDDEWPDPMQLATGSDAARVSVIAPGQLEGLAQRRLDVLIQAAGRIAEASDVVQLAQAAARAAGEGTDAARALLLRATGDGSDYEVIGAHGFTDSSDDGRHAISHSLVEAGMEGKMAQLQSWAPPSVNAPSIMNLGIGSAICAPILVDSTVEALLYLDARGRERALANDAAAFCQALAGYCGLAFANLRRVEMERQQVQLRQDLDAARRAQEQIMPPPTGRVGPITYASMCAPGRLVAGDLFDVVAIDEDRAMVMLGDVSGKGVGAALLMATTQSFLRAAAEHSQDPSRLLVSVNEHVCDRSGSGTFVTLWLGVIDRASGTLRFCDAGHGHWCMVPPGEPPRLVEHEHHLPIGVQRGEAFEAMELTITPGTRVVLFSDGLVEQTERGGRRQHGLDSVLAVLADSDSVETDVECLERAVRLHAGGAELEDDLTIASIGFDAS